MPMLGNDALRFYNCRPTLFAFHRPPCEKLPRIPPTTSQRVLHLAGTISLEECPSVVKIIRQALHAGTNSLESTSTDFERPLKDSSSPLAGQPENSPEIPETPTVALKSVRRGGDDHSDDGNTLSVSLIFVDTGRPRLAECVVGCEHC